MRQDEYADAYKNFKLPFIDAKREPQQQHEVDYCYCDECVNRSVNLRLSIAKEQKKAWRKR